MSNPATRLLGLLAALQRRRRWSGSELADYLAVTSRTLRRDVDRLRSLGYSVDASAGLGGGYQLGTGSLVPPLLLEDAEAVAVAVALRTAADAYEGLAEPALRVLVKLEPLLPSRLRRRVTALREVTVSVGEGLPAVDADVLTAVAAACRDHLALRFPYRDRDGRESVRAVEPLRLAFTAGRLWYLIAWDRDREDWRTFRVDRMGAPVEPGASFTPRRLPKDVGTYLMESLARAPHRVQVRAGLRGSVEAVTAKLPHLAPALTPRGADGCWLALGGTTLESVASQLCRVAPYLEAIEPPEHAEALAALFARLQGALTAR